MILSFSTNTFFSWLPSLPSWCHQWPQDGGVYSRRSEPWRGWQGVYLCRDLSTAARQNFISLQNGCHALREVSEAQVIVLTKNPIAGKPSHLNLNQFARRNFYVSVFFLALLLFSWEMFWVCLLRMKVVLAIWDFTLKSGMNSFLCSSTFV